MSDNVILLGAGASFDAGIPLLGNFVERMSHMSQTGRSIRGIVSKEDREIFRKAMDIRDKLESYHARVAIDQFNLEQIMSVLAFETYAGGRGSRKDLEDFTKAITRTIELTCNVIHDGKLDRIQEEGAGVYKNFWSSLFNLYKDRMVDMPSILSFNYDLVLERSLFQMAVGTNHLNMWNHVACGGFCLDYQNENCGNTIYRILPERWTPPGSFDSKQGHILKPFDEPVSQIPNDFVRIRLLKLHGALNFPARKTDGPWSPVVALPDAKIIPPVFNKTVATFASPIWKAGLTALRNCKNLIICGYSLPTTDTYMQYFLKSALGPNRQLNRIYVFDPELFKGGIVGEALRKRYSECFSPQLQSRIIFEPDLLECNPVYAGTFAHMVYLQKKSADSLFFGLLPSIGESTGREAENVHAIRSQNKERFAGL